MRSLSALVTALLIVTACTPPVLTPSPLPAGTGTVGSSTPLPTSSAAAALPDMSQILLTSPLPLADAFALNRSMRGRDGTPAKEFEPLSTTPPVEDIGTSKPFWTYDFAAKKNLRITATLQIVTDHAKWWVQDDITVDLVGLRQNAAFFEANTYPNNRRIYGSEWTPGIDGDPRINVMLARIPGAAAGYFSSTDLQPLWVNEFSAQREIVYLNSLSSKTSWNTTIAHEFCHMIEYGRRKRSSVWFNEGMAQLCEQANGFPFQFAQTFIRLPDTQLNDWTDLETATAHYGTANLFLEFLRQQAGGDALINAFIDKGIDTEADLDTVLQARGQKGLDELYANFVAANAFIGSTPVDPAMSYPNGMSSVRTPATASDQDRVLTGNKLATSVHNYAARYIELPRGNISVKFNAGVRTKLLPTDPHSGSAFWWSDRADGLDSRLTRAVDLAKATQQVLSFWTWYEIEKDYDYAYVAVSTDNGQHWATLPAPATTKDDPNGANLGNGFTANSGGEKDRSSWVKQEVDLSAYAGKQVLLRFQYVTDGALSLHGFAVDDIQIPGVLADDAEADNGWQADGFVRSANVVAQRYIVQLLRFTAQGATVDRKIVDNGSVVIDVDTSNDRKAPLLAVTGVAVRTTQPVPFQVAVDKR